MFNKMCFDWSTQVDSIHSSYAPRGKRNLPSVWLAAFRVQSLSDLMFISDT